MCASASLSSDSESNFGRKELNRHLSNANGFRRRFSQSLDYTVNLPIICRLIMIISKSPYMYTSCCAYMHVHKLRPCNGVLRAVYLGEAQFKCMITTNENRPTCMMCVY